MKEICRLLTIAMLAASSQALCGCGADYQYELAPVTGTLFCQGEPAGAGIAIQFTPLTQEGRQDGRPGKQAFAVTDENGRFTLSTYVDNDGVVIGKHRVTAARMPTDTEEDAGTEPVPFTCQDSELEVTVEAGGMEDLVLDF